MVSMTANTQEQYPNLAALCRDDMRTFLGKDGVLNAFTQFGQMTEDQARSSVTWLQPPKLEVRAHPDGLKGIGWFNENIAADTVFLTNEFADLFREDFANANTRNVAMIAVLHELVHWGDFRKDGQHLDEVTSERLEAGNEFEDTAFGRILGWPEVEASTYQPIKCDTRGIRNNNPGNIKVKDDWQGLAPISQRLKFQKDEHTFNVFSDSIFGIRALMRTLRTYGRRGDNTVKKIIRNWAPPSENNTIEYIFSVCEQTGFDADEPIDVEIFLVGRLLAQAIIKHENGYAPYRRTEYERAHELAMQD